MSNQSPADKLPSSDRLLDLLLDALLKRQAMRREEAAKPVSGPEQPLPQPAPPTAPPPPVPSAPVEESPRQRMRREPEPGEEGWEPPPQLPSINLGKTLSRLLLLIAVLIVLVNLPVARYGVSLARLKPESAALIIRDGLILKSSGPEIYKLEDNKLRWISSLDAFEHLGLKWDDVHIVEDEFLARFEQGRPIHVLLKCQDSPHIYRLENQQKRWIKDIDTFLAEGHVWEDVRFVPCDYLREIPDGLPIPEDAGPPPQP